MTIIRKTFPAFILKADDSQGIVEAIVSVTGIPDLAQPPDIILSGAFKKTVMERGLQVRVLNGHQWGDVRHIVGVPVEMREISRDELPPEVLQEFPDATGGLYTKTRYFLDTPEGEGVFKRIKEGVVEYSIGFEIKESYREKRPLADGSNVVCRVIKQVMLIEYSAVILGMNPGTATVSVKSDESPQGENKERDDNGTPIMRLGDYLMGCMRMGVDNAVNGLFKEGWLTDDERGTVANALDRAMETFKVALSDDLALMPLDMMMYFYFGNAAPSESKAGRVLSAKNASKIKGAYDELGAVLESAGILEAAADGSTENDSPDKGASTPDSNQVGPDSESEPPTVNDDDLSYEAMALLAEIELLNY